MTTKQIITLTGIVVMIALALILKPFTIIDSGDKKVVLRLGAVDRVLGEGLHYKNPFIEDLVKFSVRTQKIEVAAQASSKDLQIVSTTIALNFNINPMKVGEIYTEFQTDYQRIVIDPAIQDEVKAATAKYTAEELITKREQVKTDILDALKTRLSNNNIVVTNLSLTDFKFSTAFDSAIEQKVTAEQNALKAENDLARVQFEQQQEIEKYKAQAEQTRLQGQALRQGTAFLELKRLEVEMEYAKKWSGNLPQQMIPGGAIPFIRLDYAK